MKRTSAIRVLGRYLDDLCGPVPRVVTAANLKALKPDDWLTVYHGTRLDDVAELINGFDSTKVKSRHYNAPRHKGMFVAPNFKTARKFGHTVLEMVVRAKNLHGTDYGGVTGRQDPRREEIWKDKYPDSFRPYLSLTLHQSNEPQALLLELVAPRQIKRVWYDGDWYSRKEFLDLGLGYGMKGQKTMRDLGFDRSYPNYDYDEFIDAMALYANMTPSKVEKALSRIALKSMESGNRDDGLYDIIEGRGRGFEPRAAKRYADRFRDQLAAMSKRSVAASSRRVASTITAYHGGYAPIRKFKRDFSAQGLFWFSTDKAKILRGESGASSTKWLMTVRLDVGDKIAGWREYDKMGLYELERQYDSVNLDDDWIMFDSSKIKVLKVEKVQR